MNTLEIKRAVKLLDGADPGRPVECSDRIEKVHGMLRLWLGDEDPVKPGCHPGELACDGPFSLDLGTYRCDAHRLEWAQREIAPTFTTKKLVQLIANGASPHTVAFILENVAFRQRLVCETCGALHIDEGEFATKLHHTHTCQACGLSWRPAVEYTVGVRFLPGFKNEVA